MSSAVAIGALAALIAPVPVSYLVEALRSAPLPRPRLPWAPEASIDWVTVDAGRLRYLTVGQGPPLVLLHTLRTQLDMFQKIIPALARRFRVYALDYPGHGYSDIPGTEYTVEFFVASVAQFLDRLGIEDATVAGESIGGTIALLLAARRNPRVRRVVAINPYDYDRGRGLRRSSMLANLLFGITNVPVLGATVIRLRSYPIEKHIFEGGVRRPGAMPPDLSREMYRVGNRRGHYHAFMSLVRHWPEWERARAEYRNIIAPVLLLYGDHDWSRSEEREADQRVIPGAQMRVVPDGGHFLSLDAQEEVIQAIVEFAAAG